jgi:hypothetical protein
MLTRVPIPPAAERRIRREARSATLRERALALRQAGETYASIGRVLGVSLERARQIARKAERLANAPRWYDGLPQRAINLLKRCRLDDLPEIEAARAVARLSRRELLSFPNFGRVALAALCAWLATHGLSPENKKSAPSPKRPPDCKQPVSSGPDQQQARRWSPPTAT